MWFPDGVETGLGRGPEADLASQLDHFMATSLPVWKMNPNYVLNSEDGGDDDVGDEQDEERDGDNLQRS